VAWLWLIGWWGPSGFEEMSQRGLIIIIFAPQQEGLKFEEWRGGLRERLGESALDTGQTITLVPE